MKCFRLKLLIILFLVTGLFTLAAQTVDAHRSGCHRWHSCPSDSGSYTCGDAGYPCQYPTYPASGGVVYPPSGYYKDCYTCSTKKVPTATPSRIYNFLRKGSSNNSVKTLQLGLVKEGVYKEAIVSGYYGTLTENAIKKFQVKYGIVNYGTPQTTGYGNFGPKTQKKFNEIFGGRSVKKPTLTKTTQTNTMSIKANNKMCVDHFGLNIHWNGTKTSSGSIVCGCDSGYTFNSERTGCVSTEYASTHGGSSVVSSNSVSGKDYYLANRTCVGLFGDKYGECINYAYNH